MTPAARVGDPVAAIDTPALVIDLDAMQRNIARMAAFAATHGLRLRPHAKTHKCAPIAALQLAAGAVGVCVQKLGEAEVLADAGVTDIYLTNEIVDRAKLSRLAALAPRVTLSVAVDSSLGVDRLAQALSGSSASVTVFVEIDVGHGRCGIAPAASGALAHQVVSHGLRFGGLQAYHGRAQHLRGDAERSAAIAHAVAMVRAAQASITSAGIACPLVTGAGTGSFVHEAASGVYGELQAGSYIFMDRDYSDNQPSAGAPVFEQALFVKSQVMSWGTSHVVAGRRAQGARHRLGPAGGLGPRPSGVQRWRRAHRAAPRAEWCRIARLGRTGVAGARPLRSDRQFARPLHRRARRSRCWTGRVCLGDRRARRAALTLPAALRANP